MIVVKQHYEDGNTVTARFNGTEQEAHDYYVGKPFNLGVREDNVQVCVRIEILE